MKFQDYTFKPYIYKALEELVFFQPTMIQQKVIPIALSGENIIGTSQTGTGKTHAFLLPILQNLKEDSQEVQAVILSPTRELAFQLFDELHKMTKHSKQAIDARLYVGGSNKEAELKRLNKSQPQIVVGTLGKIKDLSIFENTLKVHTAQTVVIDEADMIFESSEMEEVDELFARFSKEVQIMVFSATIPEAMIQFLHKYLSKTEVVDLTSNKLSKSTIEHIFIPTKNKNKDELLLKLLETFKPYLALIFANTKEKVDELADFLSSHQIQVAKLTGGLQSRERKQILRRIKEGAYQYVVASDIASRGIDISGVSHVINYELPQDVEFYVHRTGRTARYLSSGIAISFYDFEDDQYINRLESKGLQCVYKAIKDQELVPTKERNARSKRVRQTSTLEQALHQKIPVPKKVKPGYKKKRALEIEKQVRKLKRQKISEIYKRKAKEKS